MGWDGSDDSDEDGDAIAMAIKPYAIHITLFVHLTKQYQSSSAPLPNSHYHFFLKLEVFCKLLHFSTQCIIIIITIPTLTNHHRQTRLTKKTPSLLMIFSAGMKAHMQTPRKDQPTNVQEKKKNCEKQNLCGLPFLPHTFPWILPQF